MAINLTVILGAGASVDVVNTTSDQIHDLSFRPPITNTLFNSHPKWADEYNKFPAVLSILDEFRNILSVPNSSIGVEDLLRTLKESSKPHRRKQFYQMPLYLQHYFHAISTRYCKSPTNYLTLMNKIFDIDLGKVLFLTTNYDLLLDQALEKHPETNFSQKSTNLSKYISQSKWAYVKLHGSVNWGRSLKQEHIRNRGNSLPALLDNIYQLGDKLGDALESEINIDSSYWSEGERGLIYPAISVPIGADENKINCPQDHIDVLNSHLDECQHFLVVGFSGFDEDILEFLNNKQGGFANVLFVSKSEAGAISTRDRFMAYKELGSKLQAHAEIYDGNGFDEFIRSSSGIDHYLQRL